MDKSRLSLTSLPTNETSAAQCDGASRANTPTQDAFNCANYASNHTEGCASDGYVNEMTPTTAIQPELEDQGMPAGKVIYPDVLLNLTGPIYNNETTVIEPQHNVKGSQNRDISSSDLRITIQSSQSGREDSKLKLNSYFLSDSKNYIQDRTEEQSWHKQPSSGNDNQSRNEAITANGESTRELRRPPISNVVSSNAAVIERMPANMTERIKATLQNGIYAKQQYGLQVVLKATHEHRRTFVSHKPCLASVSVIAATMTASALG